MSNVIDKVFYDHYRDVKWNPVVQQRIWEMSNKNTSIELMHSRHHFLLDLQTHSDQLNDLFQTQLLWLARSKRKRKPIKQASHEKSSLKLFFCFCFFLNRIRLISIKRSILYILWKQHRMKLALSLRHTYLCKTESGTNIKHVWHFGGA